MQQILSISNLIVVFTTRRGIRREAFRAIDDVSVQIAAGEIVGLVGESGSGKTTLALAACGVGKVTSGSVLAAGHEFSQLRGAARRAAHADVQMVFQDPMVSLDPRQRIGDGLDELRQVHPNRTSRFTNEQLMERVGLAPDILRRIPSQVSGGQAQRVSITRATMLQPKLLVADEPTSGLDATVQDQILRLFRWFREAEGLAILFVSHNLAVVRQLCDRALVMRQGKIVEQGDPDALFENPIHEYTRQLVGAVPGKHARLAISSQ